MTQTTAPLSALSIDTKSNVRKSGRGSEPAYVASIEAKGIIEPLIVRKNGGDGFVVVNGGKRLASLLWMAANSRLAAGHSVDAQYPVPIVVRDENDVEARDTSLITNTIRSNMHPVDRFEAFAELVAGGMSKADVAARYAMKPREVDQVLALGALSPVVRGAWRDEKIEAEAAQAFTLCPDHAEQAKLFARLKKGGRLYPHLIREAIAGDDRDSGRFLAYIGEKAYADAGGSIVKDLFSENGRGGDIASDPKLAKKLGMKKLEEKMTALEAEGWSWVERTENVPNKYSLARLNKKKAEYSADDKAKSGCLVDLKNNGTLEIEYGVLDAAETKKKNRSASAKSPKGNTGAQPSEAVSQALMQRLARTLTKAAADAAALQPRVALAVAIAALSVTHGADEVTLTLRQFGLPYRQLSDDDDQGEQLAEDIEFVDAFKAALEMAEVEMAIRFAELMGKAFNFRTPDLSEFREVDDQDSVAICAALDGTTLNAALRVRFNAEDYFSGVNGALRAKAVIEAVNADAAERMAKLKKADQVAFCVANVPATGWLPPELRTVHYDGPGSEKPKAKLVKAKGSPRKKPA